MNYYLTYTTAYVHAFLALFGFIGILSLSPYGLVVNLILAFSYEILLFIVGTLIYLFFDKITSEGQHVEYFLSEGLFIGLYILISFLGFVFFLFDFSTLLPLFSWKLKLGLLIIFEFLIFYLSAKLWGYLQNKYSAKQAKKRLNLIN